MKSYYFFLFFTSMVFSQQGVGIGTTNPQQKLHIASSTGTMRVESLNDVNSTYNGGDVNGDLDKTNDTFPLYVDGDGVMTLKFVPLYNSEYSDALDHTLLPTSDVTLLANDGDGVATEKLFTYTVTVNRAAILEVKYNLSFEVYKDASGAKITDYLSKRISTYFKIDGLPTNRKYGPASKCYANKSKHGTVGTMYNVCTAYMFIPSAGTFDISFYGEVSSGVKAGGPGSNSEPAHVRFAVGNDTLLFRLH